MSRHDWVEPVLGILLSLLVVSMAAAAFVGLVLAALYIQDRVTLLP